MGPRSVQVIDNVKRICEEYLFGKYKLVVIDDGQIVAAPTLVKELPSPLRRLIGSMSDIERVLLGMDIKIQVY